MMNAPQFDFLSVKELVAEKREREKVLGDRAQTILDL
jgi:hypothetical protein